MLNTALSLLALFSLFGCVFCYTSRFRTVTFNEPPVAAASSLPDGILLVSTMDGHLHALDFSSGRHLWSFGSGIPLLCSNPVFCPAENLLEEAELALASDAGWNSQMMAVSMNSSSLPHVIPGVDGSLFYSGINGIERLPEIRDLVSACPFRTSDNTRYVGSTVTHVFILNYGTGKLEKVFAPDVGGVPLNKYPVDEENPSASSCAPTRDQLLWIVKRDLHLHALDDDGLEKWKVEQSSYSPFFATDADHADDLNLNPGKFPYIIGVSVHGDVHAIDLRSRQLLWSTQLNVVISAVHFAANHLNAKRRARHAATQWPEMFKVVHVYFEEGEIDNRRESDVSRVVLDHYFRAKADVSHIYVYLGMWNNGQMFALPNPSTAPSPPSPAAGSIAAPLTATYSSYVHSRLSFAQTLKTSTNRRFRCVPGTIFYPQCLTGFHALPVASHDWPATAVAPHNQKQNSAKDSEQAESIIPEKKVKKPRASLRLDRISDYLLIAMASIGFTLFVLYTCVIKNNKSDKDGPKSPSKSAEQQKNSSEPPKSPASAPLPASPIRRAVVKSPGFLSIGSITVNLNHVLGKGCSGTVVYGGTFDSRPCAVKRLMKLFFDRRAAEKEISLLIQSDTHPHVVRYYAKEEDDEFLYIALEPCICSLDDAISNSHPQLAARLKIEENEKNILYQFLSGLVHLHSLNIAHRDLKPGNLLLAEQTAVTGVRPGRKELVCKIADMGLGKQLSLNRSSFDSLVSRSAGWQPAEVLMSIDNNKNANNYGVGKNGQAGSLAALSVSSSTSSISTAVTERSSPSPRSGVLSPVSSDSSAFSLTPPTPGDRLDALPAFYHRVRLTKSVDVFSAGCICYYVLTRGFHPFGHPVDRESNIVHNRVDLSPLGNRMEAKDLIANMIHSIPTMRFTAEDAYSHPFFWSDEIQLQFLCDCSDRIEEELEYSPIRLSLELYAQECVGNNWSPRIDNHLLENLGRYRKYSFNSVRDLLRVIRNKKYHYRDLPGEVQAIVGSLPTAFLSYFTERFPNLLMSCYRAMSVYCFDSPDSFTAMENFYYSSPDHRNISLQTMDFPWNLSFKRYYQSLSIKRLIQLKEYKPYYTQTWYPQEQQWIAPFSSPSSSSSPPPPASSSSVENSSEDSAVGDSNNTTTMKENPPDEEGNTENVYAS